MLENSFRPIKWPLSIAVILAILVAALLLEAFGIPALLAALLLGMACNALWGGALEKDRINNASAPLLQIGISLLGLRISANDILSVGVERMFLMSVIILAVLPVGLGWARLLGLSRRDGLLAAIGTAICGATAILAAAAMRSADKRDSAAAALVVGVVFLSTISMILIPVFAMMLELGDTEVGIFCGGLIQNVPQAIGAGLTFSPEAGAVATLIKMFRVSMLAPALLLYAIMLGSDGARPLDVIKNGFPSYMIVFFFLTFLAAFGMIPIGVSSVGTVISNWLLVVGIAAIGLTTPLIDFFAASVRILMLLSLDVIALGLMLFATIQYGLL